ncbi:type VI secretion system contractile sheath large subunit [Salicola sp. Rm-C-2C1-2]|uniref:type VI secretion system contractile sheath large subunit n=1 Tax=Salicola sp. Rm-C-2C1-2 TaxID=3141321 RepID=UPI0032E4C7A9
MNTALRFVHSDYLQRPASQKPYVVPESGFSARFVAEADDVFALLMELSRHNSGGSWEGSRIRLLLAQALDDVDRRINEQLNAILHHPDLKALEANWRGVWLLTEQAAHDDGEGRVRVKILDQSWRELSRDLSRAIEFDQSWMFSHIYSQEFGSPGGEPFGLLLGTYSVSHRMPGGQSNLDTLQELTKVAAVAFAPLILDAAPSFFGVDQFAELASVTDLENHFNQPELTKWRSLRQTADARFLGLAMPRMLMRQPYPDAGCGPEGFRFQEERADSETDYLWGNACFSVGTVAIRAFCQSGWFAQIRGYREGRIAHGTVDNMPAIQALSSAGRLFPTRSPVEWQVSDRMERVLSEEGFIPLMPLANTEMLVLQSVPSVQEPAHYDSGEAQVSARLAAMLHYTLCVSRFAHYLKVMGRDRVGGYRSPEECETHLQKWLHSYTMATEGASDEMRARFPLRSASVSVKQKVGDPGRYYSVIRLQPHFQLDQLVTSMRLITELTPIQT